MALCTLNPIALRKSKIMCHFGLFECNRNKVVETCDDENLTLSNSTSCPKHKIKKGINKDGTKTRQDIQHYTQNGSSFPADGHGAILDNVQNVKDLMKEDDGEKITIIVNHKRSKAKPCNKNYKYIDDLRFYILYNKM